jgi:hypothetical protein
MLWQILKVPEDRLLVAVIHPDCPWRPAVALR